MPIKMRVARSGRITIPKNIRLKHKIEEGTILEVSEAKEGLLLKPYNPLAEMKGLGKGVFGDPLEYQEKIRSDWDCSK